MIFYFSGTGNSFCVAKEVAEKTKDRIINIAEAWKNKEFSYAVAEGERIGFVYPIHAWAPPTVVLRFIKKLQLTNSYDAYVYSFLTCGDDWEGAVEKIKHALTHIGLRLQGDFKVIMPDCSVINGDVDTPEIARKKREASNETIQRVIKDILSNKDTYRPVKYSFYKSYVIYGFFQMGKIATLFKTNDDCVGCGLCEKACPMGVVKMKDNKKKSHKIPKWGRGCVQCNACINVCPKKAIDYFGAREKEIRYFNPDYKKELLTLK
ncbi:EFR1 family ferrodoxin [Anaerosporobacter faecicola]|uniref:EFR1 family ferrodoxin n=1 Tax=Anaerosporobacter faecicola TaxID=2718714 RepID=UPI00143B1E9C|nr:EFR1 family ferrodoxin [Anaerosporobacter faecicola]